MIDDWSLRECGRTGSPQIIRKFQRLDRPVVSHRGALQQCVCGVRQSVRRPETKS